jgi:hypothetical protein
LGFGFTSFLVKLCNLTYRVISIIFYLGKTIKKSLGPPVIFSIAADRGDGWQEASGGGCGLEKWSEMNLPEGQPFRATPFSKMPPSAGCGFALHRLAPSRKWIKAFTEKGHFKRL